MAERNEPPSVSPLPVVPRTCVQSSACSQKSIPDTDELCLPTSPNSASRPGLGWCLDLTSEGQDTKRLSGLLKVTWISQNHHWVAPREDQVSICLLEVRSQAWTRVHDFCLVAQGSFCSPRCLSFSVLVVLDRERSVLGLGQL